MSVTSTMSNTASGVSFENSQSACCTIPRVRITQCVLRAAANAPRSTHQVLVFTYQQRQNGLLRVQAVLRLVEDDRMWSVHHLVGDLLAAVRRQAVHDDHVRPGKRD